MTDMNKDPCCVGRIHLCQCQRLEFGTMSLSLCIKKKYILYKIIYYRYIQRLEIQFAYQKDGMEEIVAVYLR